MAKLIVGLGNPGLEYRNTRHNIGFEVVKALAKDRGIKMNEKAHFSVMGRGKIAGSEAVLALPQTYMNLSGKAVAELVKKELKNLDDLVIVCDDINMDLGKIRLRKQGSSGGHKGLESIINVLAKSDFPRLRIGIATEIHRGDITGYVLSPFKRKEKRHVKHVIALAKDALICLAEDGMDKAMTRFNTRKVGTS